MTISEQGTVKITRVFDFPQESVFRMWTDSMKLAKWWGPEGCLVLHSEVDPKPGGAMRVDQRLPDHQFSAIFEKVIAPELLVYKYTSPGAAGFSSWEAMDTVTFEKLGPRKTNVTAITEILGGRLEERESLKKAYKTGWSESFDKLVRALP